MSRIKKLFERIRNAEAEMILLILGYTLAPLSVAFLLWYDSIAVHPMVCGLREFCGIYCPGCGGTRAIEYFLHGDVLSSFYYHPFVPYAIVMYVVFMIRNTLHYLWPGRFKVMEFKTAYAVIALVLIFGQFIVKNVFAMAYDFYMC